MEQTDRIDMEIEIPLDPLDPIRCDGATGADSRRSGNERRAVGGRQDRHGRASAIYTAASGWAA